MKEEKEEGESAPPNPHMLIVNMLGRLYVQIWWRHHGLHVDKCSPTTRLYAGWLSGKVCRKMNVRCAAWLAAHSDKHPAKHKIAAALEQVSGKKRKCFAQDSFLEVPYFVICLDYFTPPYKG